MNTKLLMIPLILALTAGCERGKEAQSNVTASDVATDTEQVSGVQELEWDALIPADWRPEELMQSYNVDELEDDDPRALELMDKLKALWNQAPVVPELDGAAVRLPGFVVPLESDGEKLSTFLLVPYYGACIHVPPPPANQTVYVVTEQDKATRQALFDTVWVTGTLQVQHTSSEVGESGYTLYAEEVTPYDE